MKPVRAGLLLALLASNACAGSARSLTQIQTCTTTAPFSQERRLPYQAMTLTPPQAGYCLKLSLTEKVCMQGAYQDKEESPDYFSLSYWQDGKKRLQWRSDGFLLSPADTFAVELMNVDADADLELVVPVMTGEGMGMGVQSADIFVVDRRKLTVSAPLSVEDYGRLSGFYRLPGQPCRLLATEWQSGVDAKRGDGLYAEGVWYELNGLQWRPSKVLPAVSRRYLFRFQDERERALRPLLWFLDKTTEFK